MLMVRVMALLSKATMEGSKSSSAVKAIGLASGFPFQGLASKRQKFSIFSRKYFFFLKTKVHPSKKSNGIFLRYMEKNE